MSSLLPALIFDPLKAPVLERSASKSGFCYDWQSYLKDVEPHNEIAFGPITDWQTHEVADRHYKESLLLNAIRQATQHRRQSRGERWKTHQVATDGKTYLVCRRTA